VQNDESAPVGIVCLTPLTYSVVQPDQRSRSDSAPMPRGAGDLVAELRAFLTAAGVRPLFTAYA
jgi:hypothetical protein